MKKFKFTGFIEPIINQNSTSYAVFRGNFVMELVLPNAVKVNSFFKLKSRLNNYMMSHGGRIPHHISVSRRQYKEYRELYSRHIAVLPVATPENGLTYEGIPLLIRSKFTASSQDL